MADPVETLNSRMHGEAGSGMGFYQQESDPNDPPVYLGSIPHAFTPAVANKPLPGGGRVPRKVTKEFDTVVPLSQAGQYVYGLDDAELNQMTEQAWYWGYDEVSSPNDVMGFIGLWQKAVANAAAFQAAGKRLTPMQVLEYGATGNSQLRAERAQGPGIHTQKKRDIDITDPTSAKALIRQAFKTALGRDPTDAEVHTLAGSLTAAEKANPRVTTTSANFDAQGVQQGPMTTTTTGGIDANAFVATQLQDDPEAKEFQAASTYFPALMQLLGSAYGL